MPLDLPPPAEIPTIIPEKKEPESEKETEKVN